MDKVRSLATLGITVLIVSLTSACGRSTDKDRGVPVPNGGFENGTMEPWMPFQSVRAALDSNQVHSGKFSLAESAAKGSVYQDVKGLAPGLVTPFPGGCPGRRMQPQLRRLRFLTRVFLLRPFPIRLIRMRVGSC